jgi:5'-methylthioadenosine phosphorylase
LGSRRNLGGSGTIPLRVERVFGRSVGLKALAALGGILPLMQVGCGLVAGTGVAAEFEALGGKAVAVPTPFGLFRCRVVELFGVPVALVLRHSAGHRTLPHRINYRAMACGLERLGARHCLSTAAVGSLRPDWTVGDLAVCADVLDLSGRNVTLFSREVRHVPMEEAMHPACAQALSAAATELLSAASAARVHLDAVYVCGNGPRYETRAEIRAMRSLGGDVVGMTAGTEAIAMTEAGVRYGCLCVISNMAAGLVPGVLSHHDVEETVRASAPQVSKILARAAQRLVSPG